MLALYEVEQRERRDRAFVAFNGATAGHNAEQVMRSAEEFLSAHPFATDSREPAVLAAYEKAFVQWFCGLRQLSPADNATVSKFRSLTPGKI
jgi:hypothetical protein